MNLSICFFFLENEMSSLQQNSWVLAMTNHHFCFDSKLQILSRVFQWGKKSKAKLQMIWELPGSRLARA